jgi:uncharacterized protein
MIVDAWIQHPTARLMAEPMFDSLRRWTRRDHAPADMPLSATLDALDAAGVQRALVSAWSAPYRWLVTNDEVAGFVAQAPQRLLGVGAVDLRRPMDAVREVRRCVHELGFKAMRILPWLWEMPPTDRRCYPVYAACIEAGVPLCTQIGHAGPLMPSEPGRPLYLDQVACDFPELVIVGGHIGHPWTDEAVAVATKHANIYIDTSAYVPRRYPPALVQYLRGHGRSKVLWGSNHPMLSPAQALDGVHALALDDETSALFLGGNAQRVFKVA